MDVAASVLVQTRLPDLPMSPTSRRAPG